MQSRKRKMSHDMIATTTQASRIGNQFIAQMSQMYVGFRSDSSRHEVSTVVDTPILGSMLEIANSVFVTKIIHGAIASRTCII